MHFTIQSNVNVAYSFLLLSCRSCFVAILIKEINISIEKHKRIQSGLEEILSGRLQREETTRSCPEIANPSIQHHILSLCTHVILYNIYVTVD